MSREQNFGKGLVRVRGTAGRERHSNPHSVCGDCLGGEMPVMRQQNETTGNDGNDSQGRIARAATSRVRMLLWARVQNKLHSLAPLQLAASGTRPALSRLTCVTDCRRNGLPIPAMPSTSSQVRIAPVATPLPEPFGQQYHPAPCLDLVDSLRVHPRTLR